MKKEFMTIALEQAKIAFENGDVPVGAVIVCGDEVISAAHNEREYRRDASAHAEVLAIRSACEKLGRWRLSDCEMYVTLEPCTMCAGAILNARLGKLFYGLKDPNSGAFGSVLNLNSYPLLHKINADGGICSKESEELMRAFFKRLR